MAARLSPLPAGLNGWSFVVRSQSALSGAWEARENVEKGKSWRLSAGTASRVSCLTRACCEWQDGHGGYAYVRNEGRHG
jgi:hypothetical protein